jgi:DNA-binding transcriptional MerR regulator
MGKKLARISDLAKQAGVAVETIKFYESYGLLDPPARTDPKGHRYTATNLAKLLFIRMAKSFGFTLAEIRALKAIGNKRNRTCLDVKRVLAGKIAELDTVMADLTAARNELVKVHGECQGGHRHFKRCPMVLGTSFSTLPGCSAEEGAATADSHADSTSKP